MNILINAFITSRFLVLMMDSGLKYILSDFKPIPGIVEYNMKVVEFMYLLFNFLIIEPCFLYYIICFSQNLNTITYIFPISIAILHMIDEITYGSFHYILHKKTLFKYIHALHHKIEKPYKGYAHAAMEHPCEMLGALIIYTAVLCTLNHMKLICKFTVFSHLSIKAILNITNHCGKIVHIPCLMIDSRLHTQHHEKRKHPFGQQF